MELEYKFALSSPAQGAAIVDALRTGTDDAVLLSERCISMASSYYDTVDHALRDAGFAFRLRRENDEQVCCLKRRIVKNADGLSRRMELECRCKTLDEGFAELVQRGAPADFAALYARGVDVFAQACFVRTACMLSVGGATLELAFDEGYFGAVPGEHPFCELELEYKTGDEAAFHAFARRFTERYALRPQMQSKLARAMAYSHPTVG